jgi:hypothetical protein
MKRNIMHYPVGTLSRDDSGIYFFLGTAYRAAHDERDARRRERAEIERRVQLLLANTPRLGRVNAEEIATLEMQAVRKAAQTGGAIGGRAQILREPCTGQPDCPGCMVSHLPGGEQPVVAVDL